METGTEFILSCVLPKHCPPLWRRADAVVFQHPPSIGMFYPLSIKNLTLTKLSFTSNSFNCERKRGLLPPLACYFHVLFSFVDDSWVHEHIYHQIEEQRGEPDKHSS